MLNMEKTQKKPKTAQKKLKKKGKMTSRERLHTLRDLFLNDIWPLLEKQGFVKSPTGSPWNWGWEPGVHGYIFDSIRLRANYIDYMSISVYSQSRILPIKFQIIKLRGEIKSLQDILYDRDVTLDIIPSRKNEYLFPYFGRWGNHRWYRALFAKSYKLKRSFTRRGFNRSVEKLKKSLIRNVSDLEPIVDVWMKMHKPDILNVQEMKIEETP